MLKQRNIFFFLPNFSIGGAANSIFNICEKIIKKHKFISVISIGKNEYKSKFKKIGVKVIELNSKRTIFAIFDILKILKKQSNLSETIFISNINYANVLSSIFLRKINNLKLILIERTPFQELEIYFNIFDFIKKKITFWLAKTFYKRADYIICNSNNMAKYIKKKIQLDTLTIYPIIKLEKKIRKKNNNELNITWIGRDSKEKNFLDFVNAINRLNKQNIRINIISNNIYRIKSLKLLNNKILDKTKFYNFSNDKIFLKKIYQKTNIYINTSLFEGFPNTIVEAINFNCLIISSDSFGGIREIIKNNNYGLLYKTKNYNDLYNKIKYAVDNNKLCKKKIFNAKKNIIAMAERNNQNYLNFFNSI